MIKFNIFKIVLMFLMIFSIFLVGYGALHMDLKLQACGALLEVIFSSLYIIVCYGNKENEDHEN